MKASLTMKLGGDALGHLKSQAAAWNSVVTVGLRPGVSACVIKHSFKGGAVWPALHRTPMPTPCELCCKEMSTSSAGACSPGGSFNEQPCLRLERVLSNEFWAAA